MTAQQDASPESTGEAHTVTLQIGDAADPLRIALPPGDVPAEDVLPALRTITDAVVARAMAATRAKGRSISCRAGCAACCRHLALISDIEARSLADVVERMPEPRRSTVRARFAVARLRMTEAGLAEPARNAASLPADRLKALATDYFKQSIACPFLEDERCSIYEDRPLVCRRVVVTSPPEFCADPGNDRVQLLLMPKLTTAILLVTSDEEPPQLAVVPLPFALDWAGPDRAAAPRRGADQWMQRFVDRLASNVT
jgi:Fe-S-cluster containining protein